MSNWTDDDSHPVTNAKQRNNFVMPGLPAVAAIAPVGFAPNVNVGNMAPIVTVVDDGHYALERAKGFAVKTGLLGGAFGLAAGTLVLLVLVGRAPAVVTGLVTLAVLFVVFAATWAYALRTEAQHSAGGIARLHADGLWDFVGKEQQHLHEMERRRWDR